MCVSLFLSLVYVYIKFIIISKYTCHVLEYNFQVFQNISKYEYLIMCNMFACIYVGNIIASDRNIKVTRFYVFGLHLNSWN